MNPVIAGSMAGLAATAPMTVVMKSLHSQLPARERYPLPPKQITRELAEEAGVGDLTRGGPEWGAATYASHFGYGAVGGAAYGAMAPHLPGHPVLKGVGFGLAVWTVSYLGWLPAAGILPSATREPARRDALMIAAHVVWGGVTGLLTETFEKARS